MRDSVKQVMILNGEISCHDNDSDGTCEGKQDPTILDIASSLGKATGLVVTSDITHATPAAFGANVHSRNCEEEIAIQGDIVEDGWTSVTHTAVDTLIWAQGPNSDKLGRALDNTDLFYMMAEALR